MKQIKGKVYTKVIDKVYTKVIDQIFNHGNYQIDGATLHLATLHLVFMKIKAPIEEQVYKILPFLETIASKSVYDEIN